MIQSKSRTQKSGQEAGMANSPRCPICREPSTVDYRPFCSKRCANVDLGRWLKGSYAIPVEEDADEDGETPGDSGAPRGGDEDAGR